MMLKDERVNLQKRVGFELLESVQLCLTYSMTELLVDFVRKEAPTMVRLFNSLVHSLVLFCAALSSKIKNHQRKR